MYLQNGIRAGNWRFDADETEKDRSHKIWISGMVESKNNTFYNSHAMIMSRMFFLIFRWKVQYEKSEQNRRKKSLDSILRCFFKKNTSNFLQVLQVRYAVVVEMACKDFCRYRSTVAIETTCKDSCRRYCIGVIEIACKDRVGVVVLSLLK